LDQFFGKASVEEIRIIHPDPRPKGVDERRRLTCPRFLKMYQDILIPGGLLKLKTDDLELFRYSLEMLKSEGREIIDKTEDLYTSPLLSEHFDIKTNFEIKFHEKGRTICYLKAKYTKKEILINKEE
jgi:tRNA (guanine-N7-)-methyltransferase